MILRWFLSKTVRQAYAVRKHVRRILCAQRDLLSEQAIQAVTAALDELTRVLHSEAKKADLKRQMESIEKVANKWLKPYPYAAWRENVEVLLVALAVAMGIRTFFIQPFKIPTGSMQPTLFGVTSVNLMEEPNVKIPNAFERFREWLHGTSYVHVVSQYDGPLEAVKPPLKILIFSIWQKILIGNHWQTIWFPPDYGSPPGGTLEARAQLRRGQMCHKGEDIVKLRIHSGDYLFVDRMTYNFRKPLRGEIIVFETRGIEQRISNSADARWDIPPDQFYIKRLVALSGEHVRISPDHHLIINGKRLDASTPGFENVYSYDPDKPDDQNQYFGHVPMQRFADGQEFDVRTNHFLVMGDNTRNSLDSRFFGDVSEKYIIGKSWFIYWPLTKRFGLGYR